MSHQQSAVKVPQSVRYSWFRVLRAGKFMLGHDPLFLPVLLRLTPLGLSRQITDQTQLVVEGFPRSGNTFTVSALQDAANYQLRLSSHVHHPAQVKLAVARGVPTVLIVREPVGALSSYLAYGQHGRPGSVLKEYSDYHRELIPYIDQLLVVDFTEIMSDFSAIVGRINSRFSMSIPPFDESEENVKQVSDEIARQHSLLHRGQNPVNVVPLPSSGRREVAERARAGLLDERNQQALSVARDIYDYFTTRASKQRSLFGGSLDTGPDERGHGAWADECAEDSDRDVQGGH